MRVASLVNTLRRFWHGRAVEVFHHPAYRLAVPTLQGRGEFEPRRADFALWYLLSSGALAADQVLRPRRVTYQELARVHTAELLDGLSRAEKLAAVFSVDPADVTFIGDSPTRDMAGARGVGMRHVWLTEDLGRAPKPCCPSQLT